MSKKALGEASARRRRDRLNLLREPEINEDDGHNVAPEIPDDPRLLLENEMLVDYDVRQQEIEVEDRIMDDASDGASNESYVQEDELREHSEDSSENYSSSGSEEEYADIFPDDADELNREPLYRGAPINVMQSMLLILTILLHHNVTMTCLADIIAVINFHCLTQDLKKNSLYKFLKYFSLGGKTDMKKHYYCGTCIRELESNGDICPSCPHKKVCYFVQLPFLGQLKEMYKRNDFYNSLQHRFHRPMYQSGIIRDIYDGSLYQTWNDNGFLSNPNNISLSWYTDGIPVFKSSKISIWPIYLTINELPFEKRKQRENTLLVGLWHGNTKPDMNRFVYSLRSDLKKLADGIDIYIPSNDVPINVRGVVLTGTCDTPARCECLNFVNFNGFYGCSFCLCKGETFPLETQGHVHVYPYQNEFVSRTLENTEEFARTATADGAVMGVKGSSAFSKLMPDFIKGMGLDRMHGVDGGVVKKILSLLFSVEHRAQPFSLYAFIDVINNRLTSIRPPKFVHRMPRSITDLVHWKASELKMWFFYYSLPVLHGILRQDYFDHYLLLVTAITILSSDVISPRMIAVSRDFLHKYVREFETLFGVRYCSINVHQLLHFPDIVQRLGPLWVYSCFEYEDLNGQFLRLIHGTNHIDTQIANSQNRFIAMVKYMEMLPADKIRQFCQKKKRQVKIIEQILEKCYSVGVYERIRELAGLIESAMQNFEILRNFRVWQFFRLLKNGKLYVAEAYKHNNLQTHSSAVQYLHNGELQLGILHCFIKVHNCNCVMQECECEDTYFGIVRQLVCHDVFHARGDSFLHDSRTFLQKCDILNNVVTVPIANLVSVCIYINIDNQLHIGIPVNQKELE